MAVQLAFWANLVISMAYYGITVAIVVPVTRAGQLWSNRLATATAMIFFSCAVGHSFHSVEALNAVATGSHQMPSGWAEWPLATWDTLTGATGVYYWTLRRGYGVLLKRGALFNEPAEQQRLHQIELRERVAESRAAAEAERDAQAEMLSAVIANSQTLIHIKDVGGRYLLVNEAFEQAFGVRGTDLLGQTDAYLDPELAPVWRANDALAWEGPYRTEEHSKGPGGLRIYEMVKFPLYDATGELYATCGVALDITELRQATAEAERARDEAVAQSLVKSQFLATMSHEIRTPMNGVIGLADLVLATDLNVEQRRYAEAIHSAGTALLSVINDILDLSKIEAGKVVLDEEDFDLAAVLSDVAALVTPLAQAKGLAITVSTGDGLPRAVRGDAGRLRQILLNLASNAVKFTAHGSVTLRAHPVADPGGPLIRFEVIDTGIGVDPSTAEYLFEPFTQADSSTTRTYGGTGLGLAICRQLAEVMGGLVGLASEPGRGSTFWCVIPFRPAADTDPADATGAEAGEIRADAGPGGVRLHEQLRWWQREPPAAIGRAGTAHLLLVEDNEINQMVATGLLGRLGYSLDVAQDGVEAVDLATHRRYAAVLMDCQMPRMDGFAATRELRRLEETIGHLPIIAMTASAHAADQERCLAAGMDDFVSKPIDPAELASVLARWTGGPTLRPAAPNGRAPEGSDDPIARRLAELRGDGTEPERALVVRLAESLLTRAPGYLTALADAVAAGDAVALEHHAHSFKGISANLGAVATAEICEHLESIGRTRSLDSTAIAAAADDLDRLRATWPVAAARLQLATVDQPVQPPL